MCNHPHCIYIDILEMTNGEKLYIHYDNKLVPIFFQYVDESRLIDKEYVMKEQREGISLCIQEYELDKLKPFIVYDGEIEIKPEEISGNH